MSAQNVDNMKTRKFIKYTKRGDKILFDNVLSCRVIIEASKTHLDTTYIKRNLNTNTQRCIYLALAILQTIVLHAS